MLHGLLANPVVGVLLGVAVLALILVRQLAKRPVREERGYRAVVVLGVVGLLQASQVVGTATPGVLAGSAASLLVGAGLAVLRGRSIRLTREGGVLLRQGTAVTMALWVVGLGLHLGIDLLAGALSPRTAHPSAFGGGTVLLYLAVVLGIQQAVVLRRAAAAGLGGVVSGRP